MNRNPTIPPTVEEVKICSRWWACTPGVTDPDCHTLDIFNIGDGIIMRLDPSNGWTEWEPKDWGTHFAPAEPPEWMRNAPVPTQKK